MRTAQATKIPFVSCRTAPRTRVGTWLVTVGTVVTGVALVGLAAVGGPQTEATVDAPLADHSSQGARTSGGGAQPGPALAVTVQRATYAPGQSSGWHSHPGIHSVVVLSGTLTVVEACASRTFGPGDTYIGGQQNHLATNDGTEPVEMMVVYSTTADGPSDYALPADAPAGCSG